MVPEDWPPYRWLWERIGGRPWTHVLRERPELFAALVVPLLVVLVLWTGRRYSAVLVAYLAGLLTGHVWW